MKPLNKTELQIMKCLWNADCFLKDIVEAYREPKPAYTTITTLVRRMVKKGYIGFEKIGRDKRYFSLLNKKTYFSTQFKSMVADFFNNSSAQFASFFTDNSEMDLEELKELQDFVQEKINQKQKEC